MAYKPQTSSPGGKFSYLVFAAALWPHLCSSALSHTANGFTMRNRNRTDVTHNHRMRRYIVPQDVRALLDYHNRVRSQVLPPAANMEYMVWDEKLAKSAESWAARCIWGHGPSHVMRYLGQNLSITTGRHRSVTEMVKSWHQEKDSFSYPNRCTGSVCTHYTQMVWANTNRIGCAVNRCRNVYVFGTTWNEATLLVCNYSIKGNWVGEAPYKIGQPCSACPSVYAGSCHKNQCTTSKQRRTLRRVWSLL